MPDQSDAAMGRAVIPSAELDARLAAAKLLAQARDEAASIVAQAQAQMRQQREAHAHALASEAASERLRGYADGRRQAANDWASQQITRCVRAADEWPMQDQRIIELVMAALGRILLEAPIGPGFFARIAQRVLTEVTRQRPVVMQVCDADLDTARQAVAAVLAGQPRPPCVELRGGAALPRGTCLIEAGDQRIDASLGVQLEAIRRALDVSTGVPTTRRGGSA